MKLRVELLVLATLAFAGAACAQSVPVPESISTVTANGVPYQIRYAANLNIGDSDINITNDGFSESGLNAVSTPGAGNLCVGVYSFDPNEELQSCCACLVTPNGLVSISAKAINLTNLTGESPTSLVLKLLAWTGTSNATGSSTAPPGTPPTGNTCNAATGPSIGVSSTPNLAYGMHAWGTTTHATPTGYTTTETEFSPAILSVAEFEHLTTFCQYNQINGSGNFGQCKGCSAGGMGATSVQ